MLCVAKQQNVLHISTATMFVKLFNILLDCSSTDESSPDVVDLKNSLLLDFHNLLLFKKTLAEFDDLQLESTLPLPVLKSLARQSVHSTIAMPLSQDSKTWTFFLRQHLQTLKILHGADGIPMTISGSEFSIQGQSLNGTYHWNERRLRYRQLNDFQIEYSTLMRAWFITHHRWRQVNSVVRFQQIQESEPNEAPPLDGWKNSVTGEDADFAISY